MKFKYFGAFLFIAAITASCTDKTTDGPKDSFIDETGSGVYFSLNVNSSGHTRAVEGADHGTLQESSYQSVLIALAENETSKPIMVQTIKATDIKEDKIVHELTNTQLEAVSDFKGDKVKVFVVCNLPENNDYESMLMGESFKSFQTTMLLNEDSDLYWSDNNFLMSNADQDNERLIDIEGIKQGKYDSEENAWSLGTINVQRAMSRLDICNLQPVVEDLESVDLKFDAIALVNLSKQFYLYKQVGNVLMAQEETDKFVDDPKSSLQIYSDNELLYFNLEAQNLYFTNEWFTTDILEEIPSYSKWRYVTPNTVSSVEEQINGKTTGIVFRAEMNSKDGDFIIDKSKGTDLYVYGQKIWGSLADIQKIARQPEGDSQQLIKFIYNSATEGLESDSGIKEALKEAGFKVYPEKDGKYFCYYYYWVRHNATPANYNDGKMDVMEFGVVRNNIYQIALTSVAGLGKPGDFIPDMTTPDDPEKVPADANISVNINVLPWTVRQDNIYF